MRLSSHSPSKCMEKGCSKPPETEVKWADGRALAWFCDKHLKAWKKKEGEDDLEVVWERPIAGGKASLPGKRASSVAERYLRSKRAKANVTPVRQRTQYSCVSTSLMMCLRAHGVDCTEDEVNKVVGARPMKGASWEQAVAGAQHFGFRATLMCPCTIPQLKQWTDSGDPVMIAWNPENRDWSHASVVFDVDDDLNVYVADSNIPDPSETVRIVPAKEFYSKWFEAWDNYLVRRPACVIQREISEDGRQVFASVADRVASRYRRKYV